MQIQFDDILQIASRGNYVIKSFVLLRYLPKNLFTVATVYHPSSRGILKNSLNQNSYKHNSQLQHPCELQKSHPMKHSQIDNQKYIPIQQEFQADIAAVREELVCQNVIEIGKMRYCWLLKHESTETLLFVQILQCSILLSKVKQNVKIIVVIQFREFTSIQCMQIKFVILFPQHFQIQCQLIVRLEFERFVEQLLIFMSLVYEYCTISITISLNLCVDTIKLILTYIPDLNDNIFITIRTFTKYVMLNYFILGECFKRQNIINMEVIFIYSLNNWNDTEKIFHIFDKTIFTYLQSKVDYEYQ
ncbi:unnamed protein product (macronuclear) [Paramecium tetraurelia]|uniref:Transmembrane protein n=1 Tax=Paramecium tetraurelia TaxID=5888 RepID=A0DL36_PARTE|nr:uncharacterized protein GSPATT00018070001 [Paramecium tetraurelia]CAK83753.1 unnamed protein product [Paramecium tetraurelia]|eukprot:XP_001451150.1 hypothetical protein (macronuclear) [Paramecium tetraurelia strain d4-2]